MSLDKSIRVVYVYPQFDVPMAYLQLNVPNSFRSLAERHFSHENSPSSVTVRTRESPPPSGGMANARLGAFTCLGHLTLSHKLKLAPHGGRTSRKGVSWSSKEAFRQTHRSLSQPRTGLSTVFGGSITATFE